MSDGKNEAGFQPALPLKPMRLSVANLTQVLHEALEEGRRLGMRRPILNEYIHDLPVPMHDAAPRGLEEITELTQALLDAAEERFPEAWTLKVSADMEDTLEAVLLDGIRLGATVTSPLVDDRAAPHGHQVVQAHLRELLPALLAAGRKIYGAEEVMSGEPPVPVELYTHRADGEVTVRSGWMLDHSEGGRYQLRLEVDQEAARISARRCGARTFVKKGELRRSELRIVLQMIAEALEARPEA